MSVLNVTSPSEPTPPNDVATDLVEYLLLVFPGLHSLASVGPELERIVESSVIRILDLVVVNVDDNGTPEVLEAESVPSLSGFHQTSSGFGVLLSRHDIELVSLALQPGHCAVVLVVEDKWVGPLATAAHAAGGEIRAGERIARHRVEAALTRAADRLRTDS